MVAISASFVTPRVPVSTEAFGGVIDLSRMLFQGDRAKTVVCSSCRTINRDSTRFCKGCDGKLPAFYAASGTDDAALLPAGPQTRLSALVRELALPALGLTVLLASLLVGAGLWHAKHSPVSEVVATPLPIRMVTPVVAPPPATRPAPQAFSEPVSLLAAGAPKPDAEEAAQPPTTSGAHRREARSEPLRRKAVPAAEAPRLASNVRLAEGPLTLCQGLSFIAHAVCMNNRCAEPSSARHPQCTQVVRQRRLDEARRNPTLSN